MSDAIWLALLSAVFNGAVTWGIVSTKLAWMRRDIDSQGERILYLERQERAA